MPKENHTASQNKEGQKEDKSNGVHQSDDHSDPPQSLCLEEGSRASQKKNKGKAEEEENEMSPEGDGETEPAMSPASEKNKGKSDKKKEKGKKESKKTNTEDKGERVCCFQPALFYHIPPLLHLYSSWLWPVTCDLTEI